MVHAKFIKSGRNFQEISAIKRSVMTHVTCFVCANRLHHNIS